MNDKIKLLIKNKNNLILLVLAGILLMVVTFPVKDNETGKIDRNTNDNTGYEKVFDTNANEQGTNAGLTDTYPFAEEQIYISQMEERLKEVLGMLDGAGAVEVLITLETSQEKIVEKDIPVVRSNTEETDSTGGMRTISNVDMGESTVFSNTDNASSPYVVKTISPQIEGVVVLAEGAEDGRVSLNIAEAVQVLFGIEAHKIKVMKMEVTK